MNGAPAEVPPHGPPSPMTALLLAFTGLLALLAAWAARGDGLVVAGSLLAAAVCFVVGGTLYRRFRVREAAFDSHLRDHAGDR